MVGGGGWEGEGRYEVSVSVEFQTRALGLCESGGGRPGLPAPNSPYGLCGRTAAVNGGTDGI